MNKSQYPFFFFFFVLVRRDLDDVYSLGPASCSRVRSGRAQRTFWWYPCDACVGLIAMLVCEQDTHQVPRLLWQLTILFCAKGVESILDRGCLTDSCHVHLCPPLYASLQPAGQGCFPMSPWSRKCAGLLWLFLSLA
jgi:hypothetical protein